MRSYWKIKLWAKFVNHFDVFDNLWSRKMAVWPQQLFYFRQLKSTLIRIMQCQKVNFRVFLYWKRKMFLWFLDFVTLSNYFFFEVLVFWYIIIQLSLSGSTYITWLYSSELRASPFVHYQTIYDSPSRDNYIIVLKGFNFMFNLFWGSVRACDDSL